MATISLERNKKIYETLCGMYPKQADLWRNFISLCEVPHPSNHTAMATAWAAEVGKKLGAQVKSDAIGNIVLKFPATPGHESAPGVVLQAHLDMVATKTSDSTFDFMKDSLILKIEGDLIKAEKTTLGSDDGSGVAAAIALAEDKNLVHGPLELLFTVDEEIGLVGAMKLKEGELLSAQAKYLINIDSEDFGEITVSCAGSVNRTLRVPVQTAPHTAGYKHYLLKLKDFKGGHTGVHIHYGRANALKWVMTMFSENEESIKGTIFRLATISGGNAHNAVPSHCDVEFSVEPEKAKDFVAGMGRIFESLKARWAHIEDQPKMEIVELGGPQSADALCFSASRTVLRLLESLHHGIFRWSDDVPTLVESSQSVSKAGLIGSTFWVEVFARSSHNSALANMAALLDTYAKLYGGVAEQHMDDMPGWPAEPNSKLLVIGKQVFAKEFGKEAKVVPIHAGLECGIIINKFPSNKLEAISVGPDVRNPHTTNEYMELKSCAELHHYLVKLLEALA